MWEAIAANTRRSWLLISLMGVLLVCVGFAVGLVISPDGGVFGVLFALALWLVLWAVAAVGGDSLLLMSAGARKVSREDAPQVWNVVEEMKIASGLPFMPDVYLIDDPSPNAFAVGRGKNKGAVAVTTGLLKRLNRDELQGVVGHEIGHISNRDTFFMTMAGVMLGAIVMISEVVLRMLGWGGRVRRKGGDAHIAVFLLALLAVILAPLFARLLYLACSRRREYLADACGARYTRYPEGLASALEKISGSFGRRMADDESSPGNKVLAPMYIVNPLQAFIAAALFSTHPPTEDRVRILRGMAGAGYSAYEEAYRRMHGGSDHCIGARTLKVAEPVSIRAGTPEPESGEDRVGRLRDVEMLVSRLNDLLVLTCACGVGIRVPGDFKGPAVKCPRCGRSNDLPAASTAPSADAPMTYQRRGNGWESFRCECGAQTQLSPSFLANAVTCAKCGRKIWIEGPG
ncbi:MAG TPA: M48 family metallopeptidase [Planctomycetota bacterium]|nr:M48 family metallopeptidase [Planctomycetota bacterium]